MLLESVNFTQIFASIVIKWGIDAAVKIGKLLNKHFTKPTCLDEAYRKALRDMAKKHPGIDKEKMWAEYDRYVAKLILFRICKKRGESPTDLLIGFDCEFLDFFESRINQDKAAATYVSSLVIEELLISEGDRKTQAQKQVHILTPTSVGQPTRFFFGREKELDDLARSLRKERFISITGAGGIGKSTLARKFLSQHREEFDEVAWIDYSGDLVRDIVTQTGAELGIKTGSYASRWQQISRLLANSPGNKLFIIDDVDEDHANGDDDKLIEILQVLTGWAGMHILLTSRERDASEVFYPRMLKEFSPEECVLLFYKYLEEPPSQSEVDIVADIVRMMHYHTFAIEVVAKAARTESSLAAYRDRLKDGFSAIDDEVRIGAEKGNAAYLIKALFDIQNRSKKESEVLQALACLPQKALLDKAEIKEWFGFPYNRYSKLYESHWISMETRGIFYLLPIVRDAIRLDFVDGKAPEGIASGFVKYLGTHPDSFFALETDFPELKRHVDYSISVLDAVGTNVLSRNAGFLYAIGIACRTVFRLKDSLVFLELALQFARERYGEESEEAMDSLWDHASTLKEFSDQDSIQEAIGELLKVLNYASVHQGPNSKTVGNLHNDLGLTYLSLEHKASLEEAAKHFKASIDIFDKAGDIQNKSASLNNLANVCLSMGGANHLQEAISFCKQDLKLVVQRYGEESFRLSPTYHTLGFCHMMLGTSADIEKAIHYFKQDIKIAAMHYSGERHPEIATSYNSLAQAYRQRKKRGDLSKAEDLCKKSIGILNEFQDMERDLAIAYDTLGNCYLDKGAKYFKDAKDCFETALAFYEKAYPDGQCGDIPTLYSNTGYLYKKMGGAENMDIAIHYFQKGIETTIKLWGEEDTALAYQYNGLGGAYFEAGMIPESIRVLEKALGIIETNPAENRNLLASIYSTLGNDYVMIGTEESIREAIRYFERDAEITREDYGEDYADLAISYSNIALAYQSLPGRENQEKAASYLKDAIILIQDDADMARSVGLYSLQLAEVYENLGQKDLVDTQYKKAIEIFKSIPEEDNYSNLAASYENYAVFLSTGNRVKKTDLEEAEHLMRMAVSLWEDKLGEKAEETINAYKHLISILQHRGEQAKAEIAAYQKKIQAKGD